MFLVGKTETSRLLVELLGSEFEHLPVSTIITQNDLHDGRDEEFDSYLVDDDKVCEYACCALPRDQFFTTNSYRGFRLIGC